MVARMRSAMAVLLLSAIAGITLQAPPAAAASCVGAGCEGLDPISTNCYINAFAITGFSVVSLNSPGTAQGALWYSPTCKAAWGVYNSPFDIEVNDFYMKKQPFQGGLAVLEETLEAQKGENRTRMSQWNGSFKVCASETADPDEDDWDADPYHKCSLWR
jgi:uncharacterized protein DUF2690